MNKEKKKSVVLKVQNVKGAVNLNIKGDKKNGKDRT